MDELKLQRLGIIMRPEPVNDMEIQGVLNPAAIRGPDGDLYLFPRMVAKGNYSRIVIAKVILDSKGDPVDIQRMGIVLEAKLNMRKDLKARM